MHYQRFNSTLYRPAGGAAAVPFPTPARYWKFDGTLADAGSGGVALSGGTVSYATGKYGQALRTGASGPSGANTGFTGNVNARSVAVSLWVLEVAGDVTMGELRGRDGAVAQVLQLRVRRAAGVLNLTAAVGSATWSGTPVLTAAAWNHVALVADVATGLVSAYVNGVDQGGAVSYAAATGAYDASGAGSFLALSPVAAASGLDDAAVWLNTVPTAAQVASIAAAAGDLSTLLV